MHVPKRILMAMVVLERACCMKRSVCVPVGCGADWAMGWVRLQCGVISTALVGGSFAGFPQLIQSIAEQLQDAVLWQANGPAPQHNNKRKVSRVLDQEADGRLWGRLSSTTRPPAPLPRR